MTARRLAALLLGVMSLSSPVRAQQRTELPLWPSGAPGSEGRTAPEKVRVTDGGDHVVSSIHRPSITPYLPDRSTATGAAIIVAPGGGHRELWIVFFFSSRRRHTRSLCDWSSDVCSSDLTCSRKARSTNSAVESRCSC